MAQRRQGGHLGGMRGVLIELRDLAKLRHMHLLCSHKATIALKGKLLALHRELVA